MPLYENFGPDSIGTSVISSSARFHSLTHNHIKSTCRVTWFRTCLSFTRANSTPNPPSANHSDLSLIFAQPQNVSTLLSLSPKLPTLKTIVALGDIPEAARELADAWGKERRIRILTLDERELAPGDLDFVLLTILDQSRRSGPNHLYLLCLPQRIQLRLFATPP